ncbi:MAG TPA: tryptophan synthase subunit alpha [Pyrinomonadaceae bacterium]|nr:tryptophan synthase subunit alpha [Pyrinomonadaceae bacterium]
MNRLESKFAQLRQNQQRGFIPFITAGDPNLKATRNLILELANTGATAIELGVPFSDPMADGPIIQRASERALRNDVNISAILEMVVEVRKLTEVPLVLFSYYNPLLQFGIEKLAREAASAGIDAVLITDLPPEESEKIQIILASKQIKMIYLVAPTTTDARLKNIAAKASGFIYAVSRNGVTGIAEQENLESEKLVRRVRDFTDLPVAVGFGISSRAHVANVLRYADAAIVGSAIVAEIEQHRDNADLVQHVGRFARALLSD